MTRQRIFISHASGDAFIVPLLDKLLQLHGHEPWYAQSDLRGGDLFYDKIREELASSDVLIVIVSQHTLASTWVTTEIAKFRALKPAAQVIPFVLDEFDKQHLDRISPGLSAVHAIGCDNCLLGGFQKLFTALGRDFLSKRALGNRRQEPDRRCRGDRRAASVCQRLSLGLLVTYTRDTGNSVAEATHLTTGDLEALRPTVLREISRYFYIDKRDRREIPADRVLVDAVEHVESLLNPGIDAVGAFRRLAAYVCERYEVNMIERRQPERRRENS